MKQESYFLLCVPSSSRHRHAHMPITSLCRYPKPFRPALFPRIQFSYPGRLFDVKDIFFLIRFFLIFHVASSTWPRVRIAGPQRMPRMPAVDEDPVNFELHRSTPICRTRAFSSNWSLSVIQIDYHLFWLPLPRSMSFSVGQLD